MNLLRWKRKKANKININRFLIISFYFIMTSFAWFSFSKKLDSNMNLDMISWNIIFSKDNNIITNTDNVDFSFSNLYPGTSDEITIDIENNGQTDAKIFYIIKSITIMGTVYEINETVNLNHNSIILGEVTSENEIYKQNIIDNNTLLYNGRILENIDQDLIKQQDYTNIPFYIKIQKNEKVERGQKGQIILSFEWPAEDEKNINKNKLDSTWGHAFAKYFTYCKENNIPLSSTMSLNMQLVASQDI